MSVSQETKERPILFSAPMVRAILKGRKTQTRRVVKPQPPTGFYYPQEDGTVGMWWNDDDEDRDDLGFWPSYDKSLSCHYGVVGDRLWVRETFRYQYSLDGEHGIQYRADNEFRPALALDNGEGDIVGTDHPEPSLDSPTKWRPSIHMPRWASRITLEITGVRVERLQDISEADALEEGICFHYPTDDINVIRHAVHGTKPTLKDPSNSRFVFRSLWQSINGPKSWDANPWVWVVEFKQASVMRTEGADVSQEKGGAK